MDNNELILIVGMVLDDIKMAGKDNFPGIFLFKFNQIFKLGKVTVGPGRMRFFGINVIQEEDKTIQTNAEDKFNSLTEHYPSCPWRRQTNDIINDMERSHLASTNNYLDWIGMAASPLCSFHDSYLQQRAPDTKVTLIIDQINTVRKLRCAGTTIAYLRPVGRK